LIFQQRDNLDRVLFDIVFENSGALFADEGVAYFLAQMLNNRGSKNKNFTSILENNAISLKVSATRELITIHSTFLKQKQSLALRLIKELLSSPNLTQEAFDKTKVEVLAQSKRKNDDLDYVASKNLIKATFQSPMSYPIIPETIEFGLSQVKEHFYNHFIKENITFIVGGNFKDIDYDEFLQIFPSGSKKPIPFFIPQQNNITQYKPTTQAYIHFNAFFDVKKEDRYKAKVATFILGSGGFGSRMTDEIRVKEALAYSAYVRNHFTNHTTILKGYMQTKLQNEQKSISKIKDLFERFVKDGVTQEELQSTKQFLIGSEPLRYETLEDRLTHQFNEYYLGFPQGYLKQELELIKNLSLDQLNHFITSHKEILDLSFSVVKEKK